MEEIWKETPYNGYLISNFGRIKGPNNKILHTYTTKNNKYLGLCIKPNGKYGKVKFIRIHRIVAETFIPNPNNYPVINHIDGNKLNNCVENLEWCTCSENVKHAHKLNLIDINKISGSNNVQSRLTEKDVEYIKKHHIAKDKKFGNRALARKFNVSKDTIRRIVLNLSYKNC